MTVRRAERGGNTGLACVLALAGAYGTTVDALLAGPGGQP